MGKGFKAIAAMSLNRAIGRNNQLPWHIPEELKWFKKMTTGHVIIMGRATWESIGRPLPNRETIVVSRRGVEIPGVRVVRSLDELHPEEDERDYFLIGGAQLFNAGLTRCSDLYLTLVKRHVEGDVFFPPFESDFDLVQTVEEKDEFTILHYKKKAPELNSIYLPSAYAIADFAGKKLAGSVRSNPPGRPLGIALSGGRIAKGFYQSIVQHAGSETNFTDVHFFWADERCVPPSDPESSFAIARDHLFTPLGIQPANIHRIIGEADPQFAAEQAESEICRILPLNEDGQPILDIVILGMGEDGHVASLFPEESESDRASTTVYRPVIATKPPPKRITIGYPAIAAARGVWVLASGEGKRNAYAGFLHGDERLPIVRVAKSKPNLVFLQDFAAPDKKI